MSNFLTSCKIEIGGLTTTRRSLGVVDSVSFSIGETIIGQSSQGSAVVSGYYGASGETYLFIENVLGDFYIEEDLVGSLGGSTRVDRIVSPKYFITSPYSNNDYNIDEGFWEILPEQLTDIDDSVKRIDISKGGNFATGYTFAFTLSNIALISDLIKDGVFLENLPVKYFIDFGSGFEVVWSGVLDSVPKDSVTEAKFSCIDSMKLKSNKIGSETIPIALNQNYNCKLVLPEEGGENETIYQYPSRDGLKLIDYYWCYGANKYFSGDGQVQPVPENYDFILDDSVDLQSLLFLVKNDTQWFTALESGDALSLKIVAGPESGKTYDITSIVNQGYYFGGAGSYTFYKIFINGDTENIIGFVQTLEDPTPLSIMVLLNKENTYNLSQEDVLSIHNENGTSKKTVRSVDSEGVETFLSEDRNFTYTGKTVSINGINDNDNISAKTTTDIDTTFAETVEYTYTPSTPSIGTIGVRITVPLIDIFKLNESSDSIYFDLNEISLDSNLPNTGYVRNEVIMNVYAFGVYDSDITTYNNKLEFINTTVNGYARKDNNKINIQYTIPDDSILFDKFDDPNVFTSAYLEFQFFIVYFDSIPESLPVINDASTFSGIVYRASKDINLNKIGVGCNGENLTSGLFDGYPDTIKYLDITYNDRIVSDINEQSFIDAQEEYKFYPSFCERNPAHQIIEQSEFNTILSDMLYCSHLGFFPDRDDKVTVSNWLYKSIVFSDTSPTDSYDETFYSSIGNLQRPLIIKAVSDYELQYDYSEAEGEYKKVIRIKNTDQDLFDFDRDVEGVSDGFKAEAEQAWNLLRSGYLRTKKITGNVEKSKWIKSLNQDGTNESEAINFIRNQSGHINRGHERVTIVVQLNENEAIKELLSFDSVSHLKKTEGLPRKGWLIESKVSWRSKTVTLTYLLDINPKDPYIRRIGIIQDVNDSTDEIIDLQTSTDEILDGSGVL